MKKSKNLIIGINNTSKDWFKAKIDKKFLKNYLKEVIDKAGLI